MIEKISPKGRPMPGEVIFITRGDERETECAQFLESCPHSYFQQTLEWAAVIESLGSDESIFLAAKHNGRIAGILPAYIFRSKHGNIINSVPHAGPLGGIALGVENKEHQELIFSQLMGALDTLAVQENCIATTVISSPFWPDAEWYREYWKPNFELENYTLFIDLTQPSKINSHFRNNLKRMLKRAQENGLEVQDGKSREEVAYWHKNIHSARHAEIQLDPLPLNIFTASFDYLIPRDKGKFFFVKKGGEIVAGCMVAYHGEVLDTYMISGTRETYQNGGVYLLLNTVLSWAKERGFHYFNWQSSKPRGGGPYNFKMQWGSSEAPYFFFTKLYNSPDSILSLGLDKAKEVYKWHFALPFHLFDTKAS